MFDLNFLGAVEAAADVVEDAAAELAPAAAATEGLIGQALKITLVGMGILFVSLLVLWAVMELLVRVVKDGPKDEEDEEAPSPVVETAEAGDEMKLKAAAAAAAYVIAKK